ncbi:FAD-binding protein [Tunturiibacter empetritectus]|uniref:UDP-N-acetylmuramate dehydrogenase n=1 Tax=Tunturiibacter empetritectus TaxID=3069691 RepID=UPI003D9B82B3
MEATLFARDRGLPLFVLGGGSNVLVSDAGFEGVVMRVGVPISRRELQEGESVLLEAGAGESWDDVVLYAVDRGYAGIECLAGIPGDVGGTPVQNVGAYGQEVAETIVKVRAYDLQTQSFVDLDHTACRFGYRRSLFNTEQRGRYIVTAVTYRLRPGERPHCGTPISRDTSRPRSTQGRSPRFARFTMQSVRSASRRECWWDRGSGWEKRRLVLQESRGPLCRCFAGRSRRRLQAR